MQRYEFPQTEELLALRSNLQVAVDADDQDKITSFPTVKAIPISLGQRFNCYMYALGVDSSDVVRNFLIRHTSIPFGNDFMSSLIKDSVLQKASNNEEDELAIYFDSSGPKHAGLLQNGGLIKSKWGSGGFWEHDMWSVPTQYGDTVMVYLKPNPRTIEDRFLAWAKKRQSFTSDDAK